MQLISKDCLLIFQELCFRVQCVVRAGSIQQLESLCYLIRLFNHLLKSKDMKIYSYFFIISLKSGKKNPITLHLLARSLKTFYIMPQLYMHLIKTTCQQYGKDLLIDKCSQDKVRKLITMQSLSLQLLNQVNILAYFLSFFSQFK